MDDHHDAEREGLQDAADVATEQQRDHRRDALQRRLDELPVGMLRLLDLLLDLGQFESEHPYDRDNPHDAPVARAMIDAALVRADAGHERHGPIPPSVGPDGHRCELPSGDLMDRARDNRRTWSCDGCPQVYRLVGQGTETSPLGWRLVGTTA